MGDIRIKLGNAQMHAFTSYLSGSSAWRDWQDTDRERKLTRVMAGELLYRIAIKLAAKYSLCDTQDSYTFHLTLAEAAAYALYYELEPMPDDPYLRATLISLYPKIESQL